MAEVAAVLISHLGSGGRSDAQGLHFVYTQGVPVDDHLVDHLAGLLRLRPHQLALPARLALLQLIMPKVFIIGNKNLSEVIDKQDKQDISEISDQVQKKIQIVLKKFRRI